MSKSLRRHGIASSARILVDVLGGAPLDVALNNVRSHSNRALIFELCYGVCRHYFSLSDTIRLLLNRPVHKLDAEIWALLLLGGFQLTYSTVPAHAVVSETVNATKLLKKTSAQSMVNAVLRRFQPDSRNASLESQYDFPQWLIESTQAAFPELWERILEQSNKHAPIFLRINIRKTSIEDYHNLLKASQVAFSQGPYPETLVLHERVSQEKIPGYVKGFVSIQDGNSQHAAHFLQPNGNARVLDACAAPGNKAMHLLEQYPNIDLLALDVRKSRIDHLSVEATRLGARIRCELADATSENWWDGEQFDSILLDAPCTGTGTIRRRPDIKLHRTQAQVKQATNLQYRLLNKLWSMLQSAGQLLYCTCSFLPIENDHVIEHFLNAHTDAAVLPLPLANGHTMQYGQQFLPGDNAGDGFYFCKLQKE